MGAPVKGTLALRFTPRLAAAALFATLALAAFGCEEPVPVTPPQPVTPPPSASATAEVSPDPAPITDGDVTVAYANGVKILVKRIPGAELSAMQLYIKGGAREWTAADAGITRLALSTAVSGGTATLDKDAYYRKLATLGSDVWSEAGTDYAAVKGKTLLKDWDETFALLAETFLSPRMPASELELQREKQIQTLKHEQESPDGALSLLVTKTVYKGHPMANRAIGTEESVAGLKMEAIQAHLAKLRETSRLLFVTAGDVEPSHVVEKVKAAFGALPRGSYENTPFPALNYPASSVNVTDRALSTNYVEGAFAGPAWASAQMADGMVAMSLLRHRLFEEVRTKRNLSYAPSAGLATGSSVPFGYLYVTAVDPGKTMQVMFDEVNRLKNEVVSEKELTSTKSVFLTTYLMQNESTDGQAGMLASAELLGGDYHLARSLPERIRAVTPQDVQAFAKKYLAHLQMVVLGDPTKIDQKLFGSM
ncbi:MAG: pitrilysin family protein [Polyangiaceae bacterium]